MTSLAWVLLSGSAFAGQVWVVGPAPGQHHDLQNTIILAQEGDIVLVKSGTYESIRTLDRSVSIVADKLPQSSSIRRVLRRALDCRTSRHLLPRGVKH